MSFKKSAKAGLVWTTTSTIVRSLVSLFQISILTRYLAKEDFGTIAIATVFIGFTQLFMDLGISVGIMHKQDTTKDQYSSLFWLNIILGILITLILISISPLISAAYNDPSLTPIIVLLSFTVFFASIGSQHRTVQQKELRFRYIAINEIITALLTMGTAVILAIKGYGVYSLVFSTLSGVFFSNILYLSIGLYKDRNIRFHFKLKETYDYLRIGVFSIGSNILDYFSREIDIIFISASFGKEILGVYTLCKKIVQMLYGVINPIITKILTPLFAKLQTDKQQIKNVYVKLINTLAITNFPIYFLVSIFSKTILNTLYGEQYIEGAFILSVLAIYYGVLSISNPVGSLQVALGRTDIGFYWTVYRIISTLIIVYIASFYNIEVLVMLFLLLAIMNTLLIWLLQINYMIRISFREYLQEIVGPFIIMLLLSTPLYLLLWSKTSLLLAVVISLLVVIVYTIIISKTLPNSYIINMGLSIIRKYNNKQRTI